METFLSRRSTASGSHRLLFSSEFHNFIISPNIRMCFNWSIAKLTLSMKRVSNCTSSEKYIFFCKHVLSSHREDNLSDLNDKLLKTTASLKLLIEGCCRLVSVYSGCSCNMQCLLLFWIRYVRNVTSRSSSSRLRYGKEMCHDTTKWNRCLSTVQAKPLS